MAKKSKKSTKPAGVTVLKVKTKAERKKIRKIQLNGRLKQAKEIRNNALKRLKRSDEKISNLQRAISKIERVKHQRTSFEKRKLFLTKAGLKEAKEDSGRKRDNVYLSWGNNAIKELQKEIKKVK